MNLFPALLFILLLVIVAVAASLYILRYYSRSLFALSLEIETPSVRRGENIQFKLKALPARDVTITGIVTRLQCVKKEMLREGYNPWLGSWSSTISLFDLFVNASGVLSDVALEYEGKMECPDLSFREGETRELDGEFPVPADALHTKHDGVLHVCWYLTAEVRLPSRSFPARVRKEVFVVQDVAVVHHSSATTQNATGDASALFSGKSQDPPASLTDRGSFGHLELGRPTEFKAEPPESL